METHWFLVGTRKTCVTLASTVCQPLIVSCFYSGFREKCPLVRPSFESFHPYKINIIISVLRLYKMSLCDAGRASMAYFCFDFRDVDKQKLHDCFRLSSFNFLLAPIPAVIYFPKWTS